MQTHLLLRDGTLQELWRPRAGTGAEDPDALSAALDGAVSDLSLPELPPLPAYVNPRFDECGDDGQLLRVVLRYPDQPSVPGGRPYTVDWIPLTADDLSELLPPGPDVDRWTVDGDLAEDVFVHLRPIRETALDPEKGARRSIAGASIQARRIAAEPGQTAVAFTGAMRMERPLLSKPVDRADDKWTTIVQAHVPLVGRLTADAATGEIQELTLVLDDPWFEPPSGAKVSYQGMARLEPR